MEYLQTFCVGREHVPNPQLKKIVIDLLNPDVLDLNLHIYMLEIL